MYTIYIMYKMKVVYLKIVTFDYLHRFHFMDG